MLNGFTLQAAELTAAAYENMDGLCLFLCKECLAALSKLGLPQQVEALRADDFETFLRLVTESGNSSWELLQNVIPAGYKEHQDVAVALAVAKQVLGGRGAVRVHGGGFAGTIQAFVPLDMLDAFRAETEAVLGEGKCHVLSIRPEGGVQL